MLTSSDAVSVQSNDNTLRTSKSFKFHVASWSLKELFSCDSNFSFDSNNLSYTTRIIQIVQVKRKEFVKASGGKQFDLSALTRIFFTLNNNSFCNYFLQIWVTKIFRATCLQILKNQVILDAALKKLLQIVSSNFI
jgi:hypothetical protein